MTATTVGRPHGYARYKLDGCRCNTCGYAVSQYEQRRQEAIAAGVWTTPVEPVRVHVRSLMAAGMGYKRIAAMAGVGHTTVARILYGRADRPTPTTVKYEVAQRILAVDLDIAPGTPVEATGTVRRVRALMAIGHTLTSIADAIGWTTANLSTAVTEAAVPYTRRVEARTAMAVSQLYDRWSMTRPEGVSADRARAYARRRGYPPPLAFDDDTIDDPATAPEGVEAGEPT